MILKPPLTTFKRIKLPVHKNDLWSILVAVSTDVSVKGISELHWNCRGRDWNRICSLRRDPLVPCFSVCLSQLQLDVPEMEGRMMPLGVGLEPNQDIYNTITLVLNSNGACIVHMQTSISPWKTSFNHVFLQGIKSSTVLWFPCSRAAAINTWRMLFLTVTPSANGLIQSSDPDIMTHIVIGFIGVA